MSVRMNLFFPFSLLHFEGGGCFLYTYHLYIFRETARVYVFAKNKRNCCRSLLSKPNGKRERREEEAPCYLMNDYFFRLYNKRNSLNLLLAHSGPEANLMRHGDPVNLEGNM